MIEKTIGSDIDDSIKLQKIIDTVGNTPAKFTFSDAFRVDVSTKIRFWNNVTFDGAGTTLEFVDNVSIKEFGLQVPMIGSKLLVGAENWEVCNLVFEGNRYIQKNVPTTSPEHPNSTGNWGRGFCNFIGPLCSNDIRSPKPSNATNIRIHDCKANNNLGDFGRFEGIEGLYIWNCIGYRGGHDYICAAASKNIHIWNLDVDTSVNAAVRFRSVENGEIRDCTFKGTKYNTGPLIQIQNTATNWKCKNIEVYNNELKNSLGPAMWVIGSTGTNDVHIHNNLFCNNGVEPASVKTPDVGGITVDGFNAKIEYNTFDESYGYGIVFSGWKSASTLTGLKSTISRNIITGTNKSLYAGTVSGTGIANLTGTRNSVICSENDQYGNVTGNYYDVTVESKYNVDPEYDWNYRLKESSPCRFAGYQLGRFNGTEDLIPTNLLVSCSGNEADLILEKYGKNYNMYRGI